MVRCTLLVVLGLGLAVVFSPSLFAESWAIKADVAEGCNCDVVCPCLFGSSHTHGHCEGSRLVEIRQGHYGGVNLDGIPVIIAFRMGAWAEYYVDEKASEEQFQAAVKLMSAAFPHVAEWGVKVTKEVPLWIERTDTHVKYSSPVSSVDIQVMKGWQDKPIKIQNLGFPEGRHYTQYRTVKNDYNGADKSFSYQGTNGFTSKIDAQGGD